MIWYAVVTVFVLYIGLALLLYLFQGRFIYFPTRPLGTTPEAIRLAYEEVTFSTADGLELHGWFVPGAQPRPVLLFFHGNAGNISHRLESLRLFHELELSTLIFDYRGYGKSDGTPSEYGTYRDAAAAWRFLHEHRGVAAEDIVLFGRSLGGAVATWLATHVTPGGLIVESTFTSIPDLGAQIYPFLPVRWLARIRYNNRKRIPQVDCPVLIIHSQDDELIPIAHGRALFKSAREPKRLLLLRGGHNDGFLVSVDRYLEGIADFVTAQYGHAAGRSSPSALLLDELGAPY